MKAVFFSEYGGPEVLQMKELDKPIPGDREILVRMHAASVNSWDWDLLRGEPRLFRMVFGLFKPKINILGCDIAGTVMEIGRKVTRFHPGDEVFGDISGGRWGGFAEYAVAREDELSRKPTGMTFEQAAAIPQAGVLALQALRDKRPVRPGDHVLINGAGGGVGTFGIQMAKYFGAEVTAVDRGEKLALLNSVGADHVMDYRTADYTAKGLQYDMIIDVVARRSIFDYKRVLKPGGIFVMVGGAVSRILQVAFLGYWISIISGKRLGILTHQPNKDLEYLVDLFKAGQLKPVIDRTFHLHEVPEALQYLGEGRVKGKVIVKISQDE